MMFRVLRVRWVSRILRLLRHDAGVELLLRVGVVARVDVVGWLAVLLESVSLGWKGGSGKMGGCGGIGRGKGGKEGRRRTGSWAMMDWN